MSRNTRSHKTTFDVIDGMEIVGSQKWERRRIPRLHLHREQFKENSLQIVYPVENISETGMALRPLRQEDQQFFLVGKTISGVLNFAGEKIVLNAKVVHATKTWVGLQFEQLSSTASRTLQSLLDPRFLGAGLKPVPSFDSDISWYHGHSGTELVMAKIGNPASAKSKSKKAKGTEKLPPTRHELEGFLIIYGAYISWVTGPIKKVTTGLVHPIRQPSEEAFGLVGFETVALKPDPIPNFQILEVAKQVISSSNLPKEQIKRSIAALREAQGGS